MKIDKNIPIPPTSFGRRNIYPFPQMKVGDSFLAEGEAATSGRCNAYNAALQYGRVHGIKFSGRKAEPGKVRIWRVE